MDSFRVWNDLLTRGASQIKWLFSGGSVCVDVHLLVMQKGFTVTMFLVSRLFASSNPIYSVNKNPTASLSGESDAIWVYGLRSPRGSAGELCVPPRFPNHQRGPGAPPMNRRKRKSLNDNDATPHLLPCTWPFTLSFFLVLDSLFVRASFNLPIVSEWWSRATAFVHEITETFSLRLQNICRLLFVSYYFVLNTSAVVPLNTYFIL